MHAAYINHTFYTFKYQFQERVLLFEASDLIEQSVMAGPSHLILFCLYPGEK